MQTALQVFRKDVTEGTTHMLLKSAVLSELGEGKVEEWFEDGRADVLSQRGTVFECLTNPNRSIIKEKIEKYTSREIVFVVPEGTNGRHFAQFNSEVWFVNVETGEIALKKTFIASYQSNEKVVVKNKTVRLVFKMHPRDMPDAKKMSEMIAEVYHLKKSSISYIAKFIFQKAQREAPDGNFKKVIDEIVGKAKEYVNNKQPKSILKLPQYVWAPSVHTNQHVDATGFANSLILPKDGKGGGFYVHFRDSCIALMRKSKMGGK
jgi:hypothetical protein